SAIPACHLAALADSCLEYQVFRRNDPETVGPHLTNHVQSDTQHSLGSTPFDAVDPLTEREGGSAETWISRSYSMPTKRRRRQPRSGYPSMARKPSPQFSEGSHPAWPTNSRSIRSSARHTPFGHPAKSTPTPSASRPPLSLIASTTTA